MEHARTATTDSSPILRSTNRKHLNANAFGRSQSLPTARHLPSSFTNLTGTVCCRPLIGSFGSSTWHKNVSSPDLPHLRSVTRCTLGLLICEPTNTCNSGNCFTAVSASASDGGLWPQPASSSAATPRTEGGWTSLGGGTSTLAMLSPLRSKPAPKPGNLDAGLPQKDCAAFPANRATLMVGIA